MNKEYYFNSSENKRIDFKTPTEESTKEFLTKIDEPFEEYLGINSTNPLQDSDRRRFFYIYSDNNMIGLMYIYDYKENYHKCAIGYGLFKEYRGRKLTYEIFEKFCKWLEDDWGIIRIQVDIEITNKKCLHFWHKYYKQLGYEYECNAKNYWGKGIEVEIYSRLVE